MVDGVLLSTVIHQEGGRPEKLAYLCGIPRGRFWMMLCGVEKFTQRQIDQVCTVLRITPDLRRDIFGEEEADKQGLSLQGTEVRCGK